MSLTIKYNPGAWEKLMTTPECRKAINGAAKALAAACNADSALPWYHWEESTIAKAGRSKRATANVFVLPARGTEEARARRLVRNWAAARAGLNLG